MRFIREYRDSNCVEGLWPEHDPEKGIVKIPVQEMQRRTIERHLGRPFPQSEMWRMRNYRFIPKNRRAPIADGVPGWVSIHLDDKGL